MIKISFYILLVIATQSISYSQMANEIPGSNDGLTFWKGNESSMTIKEIASYCAPVLWFSTDEPQLERKFNKDVKIPRPYFFEMKSIKNPENPVVYYQIRKVVAKSEREDSCFRKNNKDKNNSKIYFKNTKQIVIDYIHYYLNESGTGAHPHDNEMVQIYVNIKREIEKKSDTLYSLIFRKIIGKAHALEWYDNVYEVDSSENEVELPLNVMVEEGKHASCPDINGDGIYTPGYDVTINTNDAWGLRDVIRTGHLFSSKYEGYMSKPRKEKCKVLPPLPPDSKLRNRYIRITAKEAFTLKAADNNDTIKSVDSNQNKRQSLPSEDVNLKSSSEYAHDNSIYELRIMPPTFHAWSDKALMQDMEDYTEKDLPNINEDGPEIINYLSDASLSLRFDESFVPGLSLEFPLNFETPIVGGYLVLRGYYSFNRILKLNSYASGINLLYTPSKARFIDQYFSLGLEINNFNDYLFNTNPNNYTKDYGDLIAMEYGVRIRGNVRYSFLKFLRFATDLWGVRFGVKSIGLPRIQKFSFVFEIGMGVW